jgi:zinc D-Ala-D-Ala carboxypeptidase
MSKIKIILTLIVIAVIGGGAWYITKPSESPASDHHDHTTHSHEKPKTKTKPTFDTSAHSLADPTSIWVLVNKRNPLQPKNYTPTDLRFPDVSQRVPGNESMRMRDVTATAVETMFTAAKKDGLNLEVSSAYRSYSFQVTLYNGYVQSQGKATADTQSARPGYSEHQTGLALDIQPDDGRCHLEACFGETPEGIWVKNNAYKYGFILRYPENKQSITGYTYEPWHFRYVGVDLATEMHHNNIATLEEFFKKGAAPDYN